MMGTNYYLHAEKCKCCGHSPRLKHIGKSSYGWCFALHIFPEDGINTFADWRALWDAPGVHIEDEYGTRLTSVEMFEVIVERQGRIDFNDPLWFSSHYTSEAEFHRINRSERGPNGLLRHTLDDRYIEHGEGPWDCRIGEFS